MPTDSSHTDDTENDMECEAGLLILSEDSPLYWDMLELARRGREGKVKFFSYEQVWNEPEQHAIRNTQYRRDPNGRKVY
jgi:hypothetical protein